LGFSFAGWLRGKKVGKKNCFWLLRVLSLSIPSSLPPSLSPPSLSCSCSCSCSLSLSLTHSHTRTHTYSLSISQADAHAQKHTRTHTAQHLLQDSTHCLIVAGEGGVNQPMRWRPPHSRLRPQATKEAHTTGSWRRRLFACTAARQSCARGHGSAKASECEPTKHAGTRLSAARSHSPLHAGAHAPPRARDGDEPEQAEREDGGDQQWSRARRLHQFGDIVAELILAHAAHHLSCPLSQQHRR